MTDDTTHPDDAENHSNNHHHAREACQHATDALRNGDLAHARVLLDEAQAAIERAQYDEDSQAYRETAYDCYD